MSEKRKRDATTADRSQKKQNRGFKVGPDNLPDGTYKRKTQKIKSSLIQRAQLKKDYAKLKERQGKEQLPQPASGADVDSRHDETTLHPDRQTLIESSEEPGRRHRERRQPFEREHEQAQQRRRAREEAEGQRKARVEERERWRRAMGKARVGGQRKLGRESGVLLERVRRMVGE